MATVRAAVLHAPGSVAVEEFPRPDLRPGEVLLRKQCAGTPHERDVAFPLICGHENVGVVEEAAGEVPAYDGRPLHAGDRVVPGANVPCGRCHFCLAGAPYSFCDRLDDYGVREHTEGVGADVVADCSGVPETFAEALSLVRFGGRVVEAGAFVDLGPAARPRRRTGRRSSCSRATSAASRSTASSPTASASTASARSPRLRRRTRWSRC
jgi:D-arabinose 1-dehydrogenase-like Zn-dependent alcohol dehydrogenase